MEYPWYGQFVEMSKYKHVAFSIDSIAIFFQVQHCNSHLHSISHEHDKTMSQQPHDANRLDCVPAKTNRTFEQQTHKLRRAKMAFDHKTVNAGKLCFALQLNRIATNDDSKMR